MGSARQRRIYGIGVVVLLATVLLLTGCQNSNPTPATIGPAIQTVNALLTSTANAVPTNTLPPPPATAIPAAAQATSGTYVPKVETVDPNLVETGQPASVEPVLTITFEPERHVKIEPPDVTLTPTTAFTLPPAPTRAPTQAPTETPKPGTSTSAP